MGRVIERVRFGWEKLETLLKEPNVQDIVTQYWAELWSHKDIKCEPDWSRFLKLEQDGIYRVWTAHVGSTLAGFASFYVQPFILSRSTLFAIDGGHFLAPCFRDNRQIGWRMWRTAKAALQAEGVKMWVAHDNAQHPLMPFFLALGMEPRTTWFWGRLDG